MKRSSGRRCHLTPPALPPPSCASALARLQASLDELQRIEQITLDAEQTDVLVRRIRQQFRLARTTLPPAAARSLPSLAHAPSFVPGSSLHAQSSAAVAVPEQGGARAGGVDLSF